MKWLLLAVVAALGVAGCSSSSGRSASRPSTPERPATTTTTQATVTITDCRRPPKDLQASFAPDGHMGTGAVADVKVRESSPAREFELVGIYMGQPRIALLSRDIEKSRFVALDRFSRRMTGRTLDTTNAAAVDDRVVTALRGCFPS